MPLTVAIVGRPNVGKSTLFNRLTGSRHALVAGTPGVTRDRREGIAQFDDIALRIVDTAGLEDAPEGSLTARMTQQSETAMAAADVICLVMDGRAGVTPLDRHFAGVARRTGKKVLLVVNKCDAATLPAGAHEAFSLGLGEPIALSAAHGDGMADLIGTLLAEAERQKKEETVQAPRQDILQLAIIGRPNVGKSTLFNALLKEERTLTGPEAGITRDAIAVDFAWSGERFRLIDTAGLRKKAKVTDALEKLSAAETLRAVRFAQVVILVMDATQPFEHQDNALAALVEEEGRAMIVALNKWDAVKDKTAYLHAAERKVDEVMPKQRGISLVPISAERKQGLDRLMQEALAAYATWNRKLSTAELNRWLEAALQAHTAPLVKGRRLKIRYVTQTKTRPPSFQLFANTSDIPDHYLRYLVGRLRDDFALPGVPLRLKIKKSKNPYA